MTSIESLVESFWRDKARGLLLGQACADALASPHRGAVVVSEARFREDAAAATPLRHTAATALSVAVAEYVGVHGAIDDIDRDSLETSMAHMWWASQDREGYGPDDMRQFRAVLESRPELRGTESTGPRQGVSPPLVTSSLCLATLNPARLSRLAQDCASLLSSDPAERAGAGVFACAVAMAMGSDPQRTVNSEQVLRRLKETAGSAFAPELDVVRQLASTATPAAAARVFLADGAGADATVPIALLAYLRCPDDPVETVGFAIRAGGPTTTIAAMAGAMAGARHGVDGLPQPWLSRLESSDRLSSLADRVAERHTAEIDSS